jgi:hypothetical protein
MRLLNLLKKAIIAISFALISTQGMAQVLLEQPSGSYSQNFNTLSSSGTTNAWTDNSTIQGWYWQNTGLVKTYSTDNGGLNGGGRYSYGSTGSSDRALGSLGSGNANAGHFAYGVQLKNTSGGTIPVIKISYTGEQWRNSAATANIISFWYKKSTTSIDDLTPNVNTDWTPFNSLDFVTPITGGTAGAIDGNDINNRVIFNQVELGGVNLQDGEYLMLKWSDPDHGGSDHGTSIDDFVFEWESEVTQVSSLLITPETGTYYTSINVSITTPTEGAAIYYTTNGDDPTEASTLYTGPFALTETTTIKARGYKTDLTPSNIVTAIYTFADPSGYVFNIAELREQEADGTSVYRLDSEAVLVYGRVARNQKYIQDATASILIDDDLGKITTSYNVGDGITGITGKLSLFNGMLQFVPVQDPGPATSTGNAIVIENKTLTSLTEADQAKLIRVSDVTFSDYEGGSGVFTIAQDFPLSDASKGAAKFRTTFSESNYINQPIPLVEVELIAFVNYDATAGFRLTARNLDDFIYSGSNDIINFTFPQSVSTAINSEAGTVSVKVVTGTNVSSLTPTITISEGATISPASGVVQNFTNPVVYTVTAADNVTEKVWTVTVSYETLVPIYNIQYTTATPADSPYKDQIVATSGIVTAYHYAWEGTPAAQNYKGYFLQDGAGAWNGIRVFNSSTTNRPNVGDLVRIKGTVKESFDNTEINSITEENVILSTGNTLPAAAVTTTLDANTEKWEGVLVKVENVTCTNADAGYGTAIVNDGSGALLLDDDNYDFTLTLNAHYNVTGIMYYSYSERKMIPRSADDILLITSTPNNDWKNSISTYPNPFGSVINIENISTATRVSVSNLIGQQVVSVKLNGQNRVELSTENFAQGIYLITIENAKGEKVVRKMVKK